jgi:sugar lactone lactonase YvrE
MSRTRWSVLLTALALAFALAPASASMASARHTVDRIDLPVGWQPEGVTTDGRSLYVGSLATGSILRADPRTADTEVLARSATGKPAVGLDYDRRRDVIWVAGGPTGEIRVHRADDGKRLRTYTFPAGDRFVNDLVVTRTAVYATDSRNAVLGVVRLDRRSHDRLPSSGEIATLPLGGDFELRPDFNANGIVSSDGWLVVVQSNTGKLFRVDPDTGDATEVDLGGATVRNGDGLEIDGDILYVVRNQDNLVAVVDLDCGLTSGEVVDEITGDVMVPTTVALVRGHLWAVNARFGGTPEQQAAKEYWLTRLPSYDD